MTGPEDAPEKQEWTISSLRPEHWSEEEIQYDSDTWEDLERKAHDAQYGGAYPFGLSSHKFTPEHVLWYEDYAYKKGRRRDRGHRTRKVFDVIGLDELAGRKVLDVGCGIGQYSVFLAMYGADVTGIELSPAAIEVAEAIASANGMEANCRFIAGEFTEVALPPESFDVVLLHEVYHHIIKYPGAKEKVLGLAKSGGKIILADTMRGGGLIHAGRRLTKWLRHRMRSGSREGEVRAGDVLLTREDYCELGRRGSSYEIYPMSYLYMIKQCGLQHHTDKAAARAFLRAAKLADDVLLSVFPGLRKYCGEAVLCITK
jgi:2-polyprenyl-3-methyl-5-hydroxy-6-metoxy-1,4-benzoquinol methylase